MSILRYAKQVLFSIIVVAILSGCVGAVVGAAVDTTIEVAKVPFKVAGAAIDVVTPDKDKDEDD